MPLSVLLLPHGVNSLNQEAEAGASQPRAGTRRYRLRAQDDHFGHRGLVPVVPVAHRAVPTEHRAAQEAECWS